MKKLKRNNSIHVQKTNPKEVHTSKTNKNHKPKPQKKNQAHPAHKESTSLDATHEKDKLFKAPLKKNIVEKKTKQRSKSILQGKKTIRKFEGQEKQRANATFYELNRTNKIKEQVDTIDQLESFRFEEVAGNPKFTQRLRYFSQINKQKDASCSFKQILIQEQEIQCQSFNLKEQQNEQMNASSSEKQQFVDKIQNLQREIEYIKLDNSRKIAEIQHQHKRQTSQLRGKIQQLQNNNLQLTHKNNNLQNVINHQQIQISTQNEVRQVLESKLKSQITLKQQLQKANLESQNRIKALQVELHSFESNLVDFQRMKEAYELRLQNLQKDKQKIKGTAVQLLQMLQKYKLTEQTQ